MAESLLFVLTKAEIMTIVYYHIRVGAGNLVNIKLYNNILYPVSVTQEYP